MICCAKCFEDSEIKAIIKGINNRGDCDTCGKMNGYIYDTEENDELVDNFNELLEIYEPVSNLPGDFPKEKTYLLKDDLNDRWRIFNIEKEKIYTLVRNICHEKYEEAPELFDEPISITSLSQIEYLEENSILKTHEWENFVNEIKNVNRFHTNFINTSVLDVFCDYVKTPYREGEVFYRARISTEEDGYETSDMGAPPQGKATDGRANPMGISCLYLSNDFDTTLHEIRAGTHDFITIGEFRLKEDIEVIDFVALDKISPFSGIGPEQHAVNKTHLKKISHEIAKPLRRSDGPLDYLPTQYITDYLKSKGHQGIKYKSTMNPKGYNVAIFNPDLFECNKVSVLDVTGMTYNTEVITD
ncbi:RES family NAD+ phosphorylase [Halobacillus litoralis]|uniref:RES domain-containing protein n=1 Tax=Halobacillus litoralis TaxID=45668 RepID=A0A410MAQ4_9BACI|nr:RES family NAD+ phosphorylase [Halobacillus litoralis]QAS51824.1 hypothetical protein HLI_06035 [Halobacillus litoralis]